MPQYNIGPCECCGGVATCEEFLDCILEQEKPLMLSIMGFADGEIECDPSPLVEEKIKVNCFDSNLNGTHALEFQGFQGGLPSFAKDYGDGTPANPGILFEEHELHDEECSFLCVYKRRYISSIAVEVGCSDGRVSIGTVRFGLIECTYKDGACDDLDPPTCELACPTPPCMFLTPDDSWSGDARSCSASGFGFESSWTTCPNVPTVVTVEGSF